MRLGSTKYNFESQIRGAAIRRRFSREAEISHYLVTVLTRAERISPNIRAPRARRRPHPAPLCAQVGHSHVTHRRKGTILNVFDNAIVENCY
ncbi:hypothetical protein EVAR_80419_1 [Eumeta japonica]|uniref:Uncharacterized protein n=1 Tax=Eumeta variegata TaxID=151549 RepID=A0A4C1VK82_EUMVA|nr:hypothetical protein EVAR_80419_1 [Eumeta japonica]